MRTAAATARALYNSVRVPPPPSLHKPLLAPRALTHSPFARPSLQQWDRVDDDRYLEPAYGSVPSARFIEYGAPARSRRGRLASFSSDGGGGGALVRRRSFDDGYYGGRSTLAIGGPSYGSGAYYDDRGRYGASRLPSRPCVRRVLTSRHPHSCTARLLNVASRPQPPAARPVPPSGASALASSSSSCRCRPVRPVPLLAEHTNDAYDPEKARAPAHSSESESMSARSEGRRQAESASDRDRARAQAGEGRRDAPPQSWVILSTRSDVSWASGISLRGASGGKSGRVRVSDPARARGETEEARRTRWAGCRRTTVR